MGADLTAAALMILSWMIRIMDCGSEGNVLRLIYRLKGLSMLQINLLLDCLGAGYPWKDLVVTTCRRENMFIAVPSGHTWGVKSWLSQRGSDNRLNMWIQIFSRQSPLTVSPERQVAEIVVRRSSNAANLLTSSHLANCRGKCISLLDYQFWREIAGSSSLSADVGKGLEEG